MMTKTEPHSADWELALSGLIVGSVLHLAAAPMFVPLMDKESGVVSREQCLREHFERKLGSESKRPQHEVSSFSVAPFVMPTPEGDTHYGVSGRLLW